MSFVVWWACFSTVLNFYPLLFIRFPSTIKYSQTGIWSNLFFIITTSPNSHKEYRKRIPAGEYMRLQLAVCQLLPLHHWQMSIVDDDDDEANKLLNVLHLTFSSPPISSSPVSPSRPNYFGIWSQISCGGREEKSGDKFQAKPMNSGLDCQSNGKEEEKHKYNINQGLTLSCYTCY